jgi:hypothetical protein
MGTLQHVYVTAHGEWTSTPWLGEKAQIGIRLPIVSSSAVPALGSIFTPVDNGDVVGDSGSHAGTNGTLMRTWTARLGGVGSPDNADAAWQSDLADDMWIFLNAIKARVGDKFRWTHVKIAPVLADGSYGAPSAIYTFTAPMPGTSTGDHFPPEVAVAVSLRANVIGRRGRGRMYIPGLTVTQLDGDNGTVVAATRTALASALKTLVTNLNNPPGVPDYRPLVAVMSAGSVTAIRPAEVRVGDHFDVQRRRQHQVAETFTVDPF